MRGDAGRCRQMANNRRNSMTQTATTTVVLVVVHLTLRHTFAADDNNKMMMMWCWWTIPTLKFTLAVFLDKHFFSTKYTLLFLLISVCVMEFLRLFAICQHLSASPHTLYGNGHILFRDLCSAIPTVFSEHLNL